MVRPRGSDRRGLTDDGVVPTGTFVGVGIADVNIVVPILGGDSLGDCTPAGFDGGREIRRAAPVSVAAVIAGPRAGAVPSSIHPPAQSKMISPLASLFIANPDDRAKAVGRPTFGLLSARFRVRKWRF